MDLTSSSSSSSDEEILEILEDIIRRPHIFRNRRNPFEEFDDTDFRNRFRLSKPTVMNLLHEIGANLEPNTNRSHPISAINKILITLTFFATGAFQITIGDTVNIHKSTVCKIVKQVTHSIARLRPRYICMPENEIDKARVMTGFRSIHGFPSVIGCVDGTHVKIQSPGGDRAELYRNRKGYFSYNVQAICNANLKIMDIDARWAGSTHDSTVFNASAIRAKFDDGSYPNCYLLGDSAYPCKNYLMTPVLNPTTPQEVRYNEAHIHTRNTIKRTFGVWKRRFPAMANGIRTCSETTLAAVIATAILHNIAIEEREVLDFPEIDNPEVHQDNVGVIRGNQGNAVRAALIETVFR